MKPKFFTTSSKKQLLGLTFFGITTVSGAVLLEFYESNTTFNNTEVKFISNESTDLSATIISEFDPNTLDDKQWHNLGFSEKQTKTILKYKQSIGGIFTSKSQFKKCYAISDEKFKQLSPYLLLPENGSSINDYKNNFNNYKNRYSAKNELKITSKFNPDDYAQKDWENLGFSDKQAEAILKYKKYLGGSFISKEKFKECFIINEENYKKLDPYIILPEKSSIKEIKKYEKTEIIYHPFDPNTLDAQGWSHLGFTEKQANVIVNYRERNLKGSFKNLEDIKNCFVISAEKFEEIKPYIILNKANITPETNTYKTNNAPEKKTDFAKTDLNQITYKQLLEFGFSQKSAGNFVGYRKSLGGFVNKNQIFETFGIDRNLAEKLTSTGNLNASNVEKYTLENAPESWLKTHPYFKYSADKIIYYRTSNPDEKKIWKLIKVKPEYEAKMKLYLRD